MTKLFIAGATGVIGRSLIPLLSGAGHRVTGMTRSAVHAEWLRLAGATPVLVDIFDRDGLIAALRTAQPEVVYHQLTDLNQFDLEANARIRVEGTRNLVDAALAAGVRRIIAQSIAFAYVPGDRPASEDEPLDLDAPAPRRLTVVGVQALEQKVAKMPESVVLRYGSLYGPGTWYARNGLFAEPIRRGERAADDGVTSFLHVEDAARTAYLALEWPVGIVNIVDDEPAAGKTWLPVFAGLLGAPLPPLKSGSGRGERGALNAKARRQLGWRPRFPSWREGFKYALG